MNNTNKIPTRRYSFSHSISPFRDIRLWFAHLFLLAGVAAFVFCVFVLISLDTDYAGQKDT
jgi:hypothetical protein